MLKHPCLRCLTELHTGSRHILMHQHIQVHRKSRRHDWPGFQQKSDILLCRSILRSKKTLVYCRTVVYLLVKTHAITSFSRPAPVEVSLVAVLVIGLAIPNEAIARIARVRNFILMMKILQEDDISNCKYSRIAQVIISVELEVSWLMDTIDSHFAALYTLWIYIQSKIFACMLRVAR